MWSCFCEGIPLRILFFAIMTATVAMLALTGFLPYLITGEPISGLPLVLHATLAPVFAVCMTVLTLLWAHSHRFDVRDLGRLRRADREGIASGASQDRSPGLKIGFWALVILAPLIMGSIMLSMYPIFDTAGQRALLTLHLVSGLLFVVVAVAKVVILVNASSSASNEQQDPHDSAD